LEVNAFTKSFKTPSGFTKVSCGGAILKKQKLILKNYLNKIENPSLEIQIFRILSSIAFGESYSIHRFCIKSRSASALAEWPFTATFNLQQATGQELLQIL